MNIIEMQDALKGYPDDLLAREVSQPSGSIPSYLAISELQRRKDMRDRYAAQQAPQSTVAEDLTMGIMGVANQGGMPSAPMMAPPPQPPMQEPVMRMAVGGFLAKSALGATPIGAALYGLFGSGATDDSSEISGALGLTEEEYYQMLKRLEESGLDVYSGEAGGGIPLEVQQAAERIRSSRRRPGGREDALDQIGLIPETEEPAEQQSTQGEFLKKLMERYAGQDERARQNALLSLGTSLMTSKSPTFLGALGDAGQTGIKTLLAGQQSGDELLGQLAGLEVKAGQKGGIKETIDSINALAKAAEATMDPAEKAQIFETIKQLRARLAQQLGVSGESKAGSMEGLTARMRELGIL